MGKSYRTILAYGSDEFIVSKSRFIGYAKPINSEEEGLNFIDEIKEKHREATHNVTAYVLGKSSNVQRFSDDGEPSGTAGIPVLEVINKEELRNMVIVVTRYFGGIKLGGGGLIRAYARAAKIAIEAAKIVTMVSHQQLRMEVDYNSYGRIENYLQVNNYRPDEISFEANVNIIISIRLDKLGLFKNDIIEFTSGQAIIEDLKKYFLPI